MRSAQPIVVQEPAAFHSILQSAEALLSHKLHATVGLQPLETFGDYPHVLRCRVWQAPTTFPTTVIVKQAKQRGEQAYDPMHTDLHSLAPRLFNDWAGVQFLDEIGARHQLAPSLYGGDRALGYIVLEDLGDVTSFDQVLLTDGVARAEQVIVQWASYLGEMHAASIGHAERFHHLRTQLGPIQPMYVIDARDLRAALIQLQPLFDRLGLVLPAGYDEDIAGVLHAIADPEPFLAFTHGDPCLHNLFPLSTGAVMLDFEWGGYRHALTDAVYSRMLFPTCYGIHRLPRAILDQSEAVYRAALRERCSAATDDDAFGRATVVACAYWTLKTLQWYLEAALDVDDAWTETRRLWLLARLEAFVEATEEFGFFLALGQMIRMLVRTLHEQWPDVDANVPYFPAFVTLPH